MGENNIGYLKWDMNRFLSEVNWNFETDGPDEEVYIKYVKNLYRIFDHIREKFPEVLIENCASGGLRADLGMAKWCARINRSDRHHNDEREKRTHEKNGIYLYDGLIFLGI